MQTPTTEPKCPECGKPLKGEEIEWNICYSCDNTPDENPEGYDYFLQNY